MKETYAYLADELKGTCVQLYTFVSHKDFVQFKKNVLAGKPSFKIQIAELSKEIFDALPKSEPIYHDGEGGVRAYDSYFLIKQD